MERRFATAMRAAGRELVGHAVTWGTPARIGHFVEVVARGAFAASLAGGDDIACLVDHDPGKLIGRTSSGTLQLREDGKGLAYTVAVPHTGLGDDLLELARRGDLGGMSFGFTVPPGGDEWNATRDQRTLRTVALAEISAVHFRPAYPGTTVAVRSLSVRACRLRLALAVL